jgi:hypothetical protein
MAMDDLVDAITQGGFSDRRREKQLTSCILRSDSDVPDSSGDDEEVEDRADEDDEEVDGAGVDGEEDETRKAISNDFSSVHPILLQLISRV